MIRHFIDVYSLEKTGIIDSYLDCSVEDFLKYFDGDRFVLGEDSDIVLSKLKGEIRISDPDILKKSMKDLDVYSAEMLETERLYQEENMKKELPRIAERYNGDKLLSYKINNGREQVLYRSGWKTPKKYKVRVNVKKK